MEYMDAQMQNHIEAGISENERLHLVNSKLVEALRVAREYFDDRADADQPSGSSPIPNEEMRMLIQIDAAIKHAEGK